MKCREVGTAGWSGSGSRSSRLKCLNSAHYCSEPLAFPRVTSSSSCSRRRPARRLPTAPCGLAHVTGDCKNGRGAEHLQNYIHTKPPEGGEEGRRRRCGWLIASVAIKRRTAQLLVTGRFLFCQSRETLRCCHDPAGGFLHRIRIGRVS